MQLESILTQLGLAQYLGVLVDEGFDTWEAILDIQESDLYVLSKVSILSHANSII